MDCGSVGSPCSCRTSLKKGPRNSQQFFATELGEIAWLSNALNTLTGQRTRRDSVVEQRLEHVNWPEGRAICCDADLSRIGIVLVVEVKDLFDSFYDREGTWVTHGDGEIQERSFVATMKVLKMLTGGH